VVRLVPRCSSNAGMKGEKGNCGAGTEGEGMEERWA
jgi:hypothetical protein